MLLLRPFRAFLVCKDTIKWEKYKIKSFYFHSRAWVSSSDSLTLEEASQVPSATAGQIYDYSFKAPKNFSCFFTHVVMIVMIVIVMIVIKDFEFWKGDFSNKSIIIYIIFNIIYIIILLTSIWAFKTLNDKWQSWQSWQRKKNFWKKVGEKFVDRNLNVVSLQRQKKEDFLLPHERNKFLTCTKEIARVNPQIHLQLATVKHVYTINPFH